MATELKTTRTTDETLKALEEIIGYKPTLGTMLRSMRKCEEMSLAEFAKILKITPQKLCDIEQGRRFISPKMAAEFARLLGDSPDFFVLQCLEDELERNKIDVKIKLDVEPGKHYRRQHAHALH